MFKDTKGWGLDITAHGLTWTGPHVTMEASSAITTLSGPILWKHEARDIEDRKDVIPNCNKYVSDTFTSDGLEIKREILFNEEDLSQFNIRLILKNTGTESIQLDKIIPVLVEGQDKLRIGESTASEWAVLRQGRHKNDLPSVCVLGETDARFADAVKGLSEAGDAIQRDENQMPLGIVSDELTVIKGNKGEGPGTLLIGFLTGMSQLVACTISLEHTRQDLKSLEVACLLDGTTLNPGGERAGEWLRVNGNDDTFEAIDEFANVKAHMSKTRPEPDPLSVYFTWYYYGMTINEEDINANLAVLQEKKIPLDVFEIDHGWTRLVGDWEPNYKFPSGMKAVAQSIRESGFCPGIWTAPFIIEPACELWNYHPDWILKNHKGAPVIFPMKLMSYYVLDPTHPEVQKWLEDLFRKMTYDWGFTYHKLDFVRAVADAPDAKFYNNQATRAEAYRMGIAAARRGAGPDAYIYICGGLYSPSAGLVQGQRTGSDVRSMWPVRPAGVTGPVAPHTVKQNVLRYWMNKLWHNDPDALMVRRRTEMFRNLNLSLGLLTDDEARVLTLNQYFAGGIVEFTEPMPEVDEDRLGLLRHVIPSIGEAAIPRDMFSGYRYPRIYDVEVSPKAHELGTWHTLAIINWEDTSVDERFTLDETTLGKFAREHERFVISEFWTGQIWNDVKYGDTIELGEMAPHSPKLLRVAPRVETQPSLIHSNGHFSMGGTEIRSWEYREGKLKVAIDWKWDYPIEFVLQSSIDKRWKGGDGFCKVYSEDPRKAIIQLPRRYRGVIELIEE